MNETNSYSPNHGGKRSQPITAIIIHDTGGKTAASALSWFARRESKVSAHVVIDLDGTIYRVVPDDLVAWHAGVSSLHGESRVNQFSLGVELADADDETPYPDAQWNSAVAWVTEKIRQYNLQLERVVGHCDIAPGRKVDPGPDFDWVRFRQAIVDRMLVS